MNVTQVKVTAGHQHKIDKSRKRNFPAGWVGWVNPSELASLQEADKCEVLHGGSESASTTPTDPVFKIADKKWGVQGSEETYTTKKAAQAAYDELTNDGGDAPSDTADEVSGDGTGNVDDTVSGPAVDDPVTQVKAAAQDAIAMGAAPAVAEEGGASEPANGGQSSDDT